MFREHDHCYFLVLYALAIYWVDSWISKLMTPYSILLLLCRHLDRIFIYSLLWRRERRLSTGGVGTPSDEIAVCKIHQQQKELIPGLPPSPWAADAPGA